MIKYGGQKLSWDNLYSQFGRGERKQDFKDILVHLVEHHELPDIVEHVVVFGGGEGHVVDDGGDVAEDGGVEQGGGDHQEKAKQLK